MTGKGMLRIGAEFPDPFAQHVLMQIQIAGGLRHRNAPILHQPHCLKLELAAELPSSHSHSPVPSNTLSRCPRNRQQASESDNAYRVNPKTDSAFIEDALDHSSVHKLGLRFSEVKPPRP